MLTYYGPTAWDDEPGHLWHSACPIGDDGHDGQAYVIDGVAICSGCGQQENPA